MAIGIAGRQVEIIQNHAFADKVLGNRKGQFRQQPGYHMTPGFLSQKKVHCFDCLLGSLLRGKAGPLMTAFCLRRTSLFEVACRLCEPVLGAIGHLAPVSRSTS